MCIMRTTINIDEHVLAAARDRARERGITLGEYIERAVRRESTHLSPVSRSDPPEIPVFDGKLRPGIDRMSNRELQEFLDEDVPPDKLG